MGTCLLTLITVLAFQINLLLHLTAIRAEYHSVPAGQTIESMAAKSCEGAIKDERKGNQQSNPKADKTLPTSMRLMEQSCEAVLDWVLEALGGFFSQNVSGYTLEFCTKIHYTD